MSACTVFPVQPMNRLLPALGELARAARRGLGECPAFAPFETAGGGCSNVDPSINADAYFKSGGQVADDGTVGAAVGVAVAELDCPYGSQLNPFTGRTECRSQAAAQFTTGSGYVVRTSSNPNDMAAIAAAAQAEGRARGLNITCKSIPLGGDLMNNNKQVYGTDCTVDGSSGHDAAVLLTGSGFETLATELGLNPFFKASTGYQYTPPTSQQQQSYVKTAAPAAPAVVPAQPKPAPGTASAPTTVAKPASTQVLETVTSIADQAKAAVESAGVPTWIWYAAAAGAAGLFFLGGRRR